MGTTGGDREQLLADVQAAGTYAVIAPNMGKQVGSACSQILMQSNRLLGIELTTALPYRFSAIRRTGEQSSIVQQELH